MDCLLTEEQVKNILNNHYVMQGYKTTVAWGHTRGADIIAQKDNERLIIEVKGCGSREQMRGNYFLTILGELLTRMDSEDSDYFIAFPKMQQYIKLWQRLPSLTKQRTRIKLILVSENGQSEYFD